MKRFWVNLARGAANLVLPEMVVYQGRTLPGKYVRLCGPDFWDHAHYLNSARAEARRIVEHFQVNTGTRILDVGCGVGRLATGLLEEVGEMATYHGVDVSEKSIRWCRKYLTPAHPGFRFSHIDVRNARYNPGGKENPRGVRMPFADRSFDVIFLFSVFSHMVTGDVRAYLGEFDRLLADDGRIFLTAFVEDGVPEMTENPENYRTHWSGPLHGVRYNRDFFNGMLSEFGFRVDATEDVGQTAYYLSRKGG